MNPHIITGEIFTLQFYQPVGKYMIYGQIYNNETEDVIVELPIYNDQFTDLLFDAFQMFEGDPDSVNEFNKITEDFVNSNI